MHKLLRVHIANCGHKKAFFEGETFLFGNGEEAVDSILHADNGSGKTSFLSLFYSCFVTRTDRFMRTLQKPYERFEHCFATGAAALIATEWSVGDATRTDGRKSADSSSTIPSGRLVLGQIVVPSAKSVANAEDAPAALALDRWFFSFLADESAGLTFESLPFTGLGCELGSPDRLKTSDQVQAWLTKMARTFGTSHGFYRTRIAGEWAKRIEEDGIDIKLLATQVQLNKEEGGIDAFVKFKNEEEFLRKFLELVLDGEHIEETRSSIETSVNSLAGYDEKLAALDTMKTISDLHRGIGYNDETGEAAAEGFLQKARKLAVFDGRLKASTREACDLRETFRAVVDSVGHAAKEEATSRDALKAEKVAREEDKRGAERTLLAAEAAIALHTQRTEEEKAGAAENQAEESRKALVLGRAAAGYAPILSKRAEANSAEIRIRELTQEAEAPRRSAMVCGRRLRLSLAASVSRLGARQAFERDKIQGIRTLIATSITATSALERSAGIAESTQIQAEKRLDERELALADLRTRGLLHTGQTVEEAITHLATALSGAEGERALARANEAAAKADAQSASARRKVAEIALRAASERAARIEDEVESARTQRAAIESDPLLVERCGTDVDILSSSVAADLDETAQRARRTAEGLRREDAVLRIDAESIAKGGLAGIDASALAVVERLRDAGFADTMPYAAWLAGRGASPSEIRAFAAADPARFSGVAIQGLDALNRVRAVDLTKLPLARPVMISLPSLLAESTQAAGSLVLTVDSPEAYDRAAAARMEESIHKRVETIAHSIATAESRIRSAEDLLVRIASWASAHGDGRLERRVEGLRAARAEISAHEAEIVYADEAISSAGRKADECLLLERSASERILEIQSGRDLCATIQERYERPLRDITAQLQEAQAQRAALALEIAAEQDKRRRMDTDVSSSEEEVRRIGLDIHQQESEISSIDLDDGETTSGEEITALDLARGAWREARSAYRRIEAGLGVAALRDDLDRLLLEIEALLSAWRSEHAPLTIDEAAAAVSAGLHLTVRDAESAWLSANNDAVRARQSAETAVAAFKAADRRLRAEGRAESERIHALGHEACLNAADDARERIVAADEDASRLGRAIDAAGDILVALQERLGSATAALRRIEDHAPADQPGFARTDLDEASFDTEAKRVVAEIRKDAAARAAAEKSAIDAFLKLRDFIRDLPLGRLDAVRIAYGGKDFAAAAAEVEMNAKLVGDILAACQDNVEAHKRDFDDCLTRLTGLLGDGLRKIRAGIETRIPETVDDHRFRGARVLRMRWRFDDLSLDSRRAALDGFLRALIAKKAVPAKAHDLIAAMLDYLRPLATGNRPSYGIQIIKPVDVGEIEYCPIHELASSGGEGLAAAFMLYMVVLRLRADSQASANPSGGLLMADNPIGKMSHTLYLRLTRSLAKAMDVQLIFTTGVKDLSALGEFPRIVKMQKTSSRGGNTLVRSSIVATHHDLGEAA